MKLFLLLFVQAVDVFIVMNDKGHCHFADQEYLYILDFPIQINNYTNKDVNKTILGTKNIYVLYIKCLTFKGNQWHSMLHGNARWLFISRETYITNMKMARDYRCLVENVLYESILLYIQTFINVRQCVLFAQYCIDKYCR